MDVGDLDQLEWLKLGVERGWCSQPVCDTHDGIPWSDEEQDMWDEGGDPCATVVRLLEPDWLSPSGGTTSP